ncbi:hypothetical protein [Romboutsia sp.]|uniref:hypothetical protein n=1 Tax=Romboutsia sp. TaxID=1965302 RepID=UPI003F39936E
MDNNSALTYNANIELKQKKNYEYKVYTNGEVVESTPIEGIGEEYYTGVIWNWSSEDSSASGFLVNHI